jgi:mannose-6-phosphate isomerase-like protein (cupin superfamily)
VSGFPGGTSVSRISVYDWPAADGVRGGSPHLHTASTEGYVVLGGSGHLETLSSQGYGQHELRPGTVLWFTPGTVHRLVNTSGELDILVVMQNAGLPEAGDAVFTFPPHVLADPSQYRAAATLPQIGDDTALAAAALTRRDLAIEGYLRLKEAVRSGDLAPLAELHHAAAAIVRERVGDWTVLWRERPLAQAEETGTVLAALSSGNAGSLASAAVYHSPDPERRYGMCGHLTAWPLATAQVPTDQIPSPSPTDQVASRPSSEAS